MEKKTMAKIGGTIVAGAVALGVSLGGCEWTEGKIASVVGTEGATILVDAACSGGTEFVVAATTDTSPLLAELLRQGANAACAARPTGQISATVYDTPLAEFCGTTKALTEANEPDANVRGVFNSALPEVCA